MADRTEPTIGRVVLFFNDKDQFQPHRADVCNVLVDGKVNLSVNNEDGESYTMVNVPLIQGDDEKPAEGGWCEWMQHQVKKHAKDKEDEKS